MALESNFHHDSHYASATTYVRRKSYLATRVTSVNDIFLIEYILAKSPNLVINLAWLETITSSKVQKSVGVLRELWLITLLEEHL